MPKHLVDEWPMWRLVHARMATVPELAAVNGWSMQEVRDANDVLDLYEDLAAMPPKKD